MQHPKDLSILDFTYELPDEKIAKYPLANRDASKLLIYNKGFILESTFKEIADHLPTNALLVFNNSKVIQSRLTFKKASGGEIEIFILEPCAKYGDITTAMKTEGSIQCECLVGGAKKWKQGKLEIAHVKDEQTETFSAEMIERKGETFIIEFNWEPTVDFATALTQFGNTPIPPYLHRTSEETDKTRYQTIYAKADGSVAAPTAGLHFTEEVMQSLTHKNIQTAYVTLHVGAGTFKPVKSDTIGGHEMHAEFIDIEKSFIQTLLEYEEVIPVGTTSMRTIESLYWMGVKTFVQPTMPETPEIKQWEVYDDLMKYKLDKKTALKSLLQWMEDKHVERLITKTQIMIAPSYEPKIAKALITNFHQPQSTLLLLISALIGNKWKEMYAFALENDFRFLSYGDSSLILF